MLRPGKDGDAVPPQTLVFRIAKARLSPEALKQRKVQAEMFEPSSDDKASLGKRVSLWVEELTVADQAWAFMGCDPEKTVVACLNVDSVRQIDPPQGFAPLDVHWEQAMAKDDQRNEAPNTVPGAEGHVGISGLIQGGRSKGDTNKRKELRSALADAATISPVPVPHDIPEEQLKVAAYYISLEEPGCGREVLKWTIATRQLRRARVRAALDQQQSESD